MPLCFCCLSLNFIAAQTERANQKSVVALLSIVSHLRDYKMNYLHVFIILTVFAATFAMSPDCPSYSQVTTCSPKCKEDSECASLGGKCCPNLCNAKSCVTKGNTNKSGDSKCEFIAITCLNDCFKTWIVFAFQIAQMVLLALIVVTWSAIHLKNVTWIRPQSVRSASELRFLIQEKTYTIPYFWVLYLYSCTVHLINLLQIKSLFDSHSTGRMNRSIRKLL